MAGYKRNARGQFLKGFSGMSATRKKKFLSANKSATKARMDKQNLITRSTGEVSGGGHLTKDALPIKTNVKAVRKDRNGANVVRGAKVTSNRNVKDVFGGTQPLAKGTRLEGETKVSLSKNQQARVDDYMARPKRIKAGAAKKKAAFASTGGPKKVEPVNKPKNQLEGRDPRGMSSAEKIDAYTQMHGKPPSAAAQKRLDKLAAGNDKIKAEGNKLVKDHATPFVGTRAKTNATPSVAANRNNSTPATGYGSATKQRAEFEQLQKERYSIKELRPNAKGYKEQRSQITAMDSKLEGLRRKIKQLEDKPVSPPKRVNTTDNSKPLQLADITKFRGKDIMDYNAMTSTERNALEAKAEAQLKRGRAMFANHPDDKPYSKVQMSQIKLNNDLEEILRKTRVSRRNMGG